MSKHTFLIFSIVTGIALVLPQSHSAEAQQRPVVDGARAVAEGTAQATRRTAGAIVDGTARTIERTGDAARNLRENTRARLQGQDPNQINNRNQYQGEYSAQYRGQVDEDLNNQTTTDKQTSDATNQGSLQDRQQWHSNGMNQLAYNSGRVYTLRHDASGREFICVCGHRVYFENSQTATQPYESRKPMLEDRESMDAEQQERQLNSEQRRQDESVNVPPAPPVPATQSETPSNLDREVVRAESDLQQDTSQRTERATETESQLQDKADTLKDESNLTEQKSE